MVIDHVEVTATSDDAAMLSHVPLVLDRIVGGGSIPPYAARRLEYPVVKLGTWVVIDLSYEQKVGRYVAQMDDRPIMGAGVYFFANVALFHT